ncbi:MAG TPA: hypothetical protein VE074_03060 [Jatrophihabitantaceae bacterium]|nr:hypothetical protein [Jatrophihabitantaceae bacterium]
MRTTVTLDPDVETLLKNRMSERGLTFKQALNAALREALTGGAQRKQFRTKTHDMGVPKVDITHALRLAGDLEDEEIIRKMRLGK